MRPSSPLLDSVRDQFEGKFYRQIILICTLLTDCSDREGHPNDILLLPSGKTKKLIEVVLANQQDMTS